jgi:hypothetical protein
MERFLSLVQALHARRVRFVLIGVWGANYHAQFPPVVFTTQDHGLFLPPDPGNLMLAWEACAEVDLDLTCSREPSVSLGICGSRKGSSISERSRAASFAVSS